MKIEVLCKYKLLHVIALQTRAQCTIYVSIGSITVNVAAYEHHMIDNEKFYDQSFQNWWSKMSKKTEFIPTISVHCSYSNERPAMLLHTDTCIGDSIHDSLFTSQNSAL